MSDSTKSEHHRRRRRWHGSQDENKNKLQKNTHEVYKQLQMQLILEIWLYDTFVCSHIGYKNTIPKKSSKNRMPTAFHSISFIYRVSVCVRVWNMTFLSTVFSRLFVFWFKYLKTGLLFSEIKKVRLCACATKIVIVASYNLSWEMYEMPHVCVCV